MTVFPSNPTDGQLHPADNGAYYVYNQSQNQWQSTTVIPKWTDQVFVRGQDNVTQQNTNDSAERALKRSTNQSVQVDQLLEVAIGVKSRGVWAHQGGVTVPGATGEGVAKTKFLMQRDPNEKVQAYEDATCFLISDEAVGTDNKVKLGITEPGDILTVQDNYDLEGGTYLITAVEEFADYLKLKVVCHKERTKGTASPDELATIRIIKDQLITDEHFDHRYLQLGTANEVTNQFRVKGNGGTYISTAGDELGIYHLKTPTDGGHAANKSFVEDEIKKAAVNNLIPYNYVIREVGAMQPGQMMWSDQNFNAITEWADAEYLVFSGVDANGNRPFRDTNRANWKRALGSAVTVLTDEQTMIWSLANAGSAEIFYEIALDSYYVRFWKNEDESRSVGMADAVGPVTNAQYLLHIPDLRF